MKEFRAQDGEITIVGSLPEINKRFALVEKPPATIRVLPVFEVDQFPQVLKSDAFSRMNDLLEEPRVVAERLAAHHFQAVFGRVSLLRDENTCAEVRLDKNQNITAIIILFGTELIKASAESVAGFAQGHHAEVLSGPELAKKLSLLDRELWEQQSARYGALAFGPFCAGMGAPVKSVAIGSTDPRIWASSDAGYVPSGSAEPPLPYDPRQFQN